MVTRFTAAAIALVTLLPPTLLGAQDTDGIRRAIAAYNAALNAGDANRVMALCAADAVIMLPDTPPLEGPTAIRAYFEQNVFGLSTYDYTFAPVEIRVFDGWGFVRADITGTYTVKATGKVISVNRRGILLMARAGTGPWKIARYVVHRNGPE